MVLHHRSDWSKATFQLLIGKNEPQMCSPSAFPAKLACTRCLFCVFCKFFNPCVTSSREHPQYLVCAVFSSKFRSWHLMRNCDDFHNLKLLKKAGASHNSLEMGAVSMCCACSTLCGGCSSPEMPSSTSLQQQLPEEVSIFHGFFLQSLCQNLSPWEQLGTEEKGKKTDDLLKPWFWFWRKDHSKPWLRCGICPFIFSPVATSYPTPLLSSEVALLSSPASLQLQIPLDPVFGRVP